MLKARYFKHFDIMEATIIPNSSFIWRSLLWSRDIIREGTIWKIGNRETINARKGIRIPSIRAERITSNVSYDSNVKVKELINSDYDWDTLKINCITLPFEAQVYPKYSY